MSSSSNVFFLLFKILKQTVEYKIQYDGKGGIENCMIGDDKLPKTCTVTFNIEKNMKQPIYVYYGLDNFYQVLFIDLQNHRKYVQSRSDSQLNGEQLDAKDLDDCEPLVHADDGRILSPCGLAANSFFNDTFTISDANADIEMYESDISWKSDREKKFKNPTNRDTTRYKYLYINLYYSDETYPNIINAERSPDRKNSNYYGGGVQNEHFVVWMRTSALPNFRKLYGRIEEDINKGTTLSFTIVSSIY